MLAKTSIYFFIFTKTDLIHLQSDTITTEHIKIING